MLQNSFKATGHRRGAEAESKEKGHHQNVLEKSQNNTREDAGKIYIKSAKAFAVCAERWDSFQGYKLEPFRVVIREDTRRIAMQLDSF